MNQSFLFLQGVASPFFAELGKALVGKGYQVLKINFCGGDRLFSNRLDQLDYRGSLTDLPEFLHDILTKYQITDIVLFGDTRPVHLDAIKLAKQQAINVHVFEEGYLRPGWITLETGGVNAHSSLPKDPQWYQHYAETLTTSPHVNNTGKQLLPRAWHDMRYHLGSFVLKTKFPHYHTHRPDTPLTEYIGWTKRFPAIWLFHKKRAQQKISALLKNHKLFYVLPLQLSADAQIRQHSAINSMSDFIHCSIKSFVRYAPADSQLVIKNHPLDTGLVNYPDVIDKAVKQHQLNPQRVVYLETGDLNALLAHASGTLVVNSTVGLQAIRTNCPTIALGKAIYALPGMTYQGNLDDFWHDALDENHKPDAKLVDAFCQSIIALTQINGDFYTRQGIKLAVSGSVEHLVSLPQQDTQSTQNSFEQQVLNKA